MKTGAQIKRTGQDLTARKIPLSCEVFKLVVIDNLIDPNARFILHKIGDGEKNEISIESAELVAFLDRIESATEPQYLVIGVRPNAFSDFEAVRSKAEARRLLIGYEPLEEGLKVIIPSPLGLENSPQLRSQ